MSQRVELLVWAASLSMIAGPASGQTIAEYGRAQRAAIEEAMALTAARSASQAPSAPTSAPVPVAAAATVPRRAIDPEEPALRVAGTFSSTSQALVEIAVDGVPYLLLAGQRVPGTRWHVESVAVDRIVLERASNSSGAPDGATRKSYVLPALR